MGLFGKKNNDKDNSEEEIKDVSMLEGADLDALIMSAIEETDLEQAQEKEQARINEQERVARITREREEAAKKKKVIVRRFFLMVTASEDQGDGLFGLKGSVHGEIRKNDKVYVYRPNGSALEGTVESIETDSDETVDVIKAAVGRINVRFASVIEEGTTAEEFVPFYSVLTCVKPVDRDDLKTPVENPFLLGLSLEYKNYMKDKQYMRLLIKNIAEGRFIVPILPAQPNPDGGKPIIKLVTLTKPDDESKMVPFFTDIVALSSWKELFEKQGKPSIAMLTFKDLAKNTLPDGPEFVLNPFGPLTINFPREVINNIAGLLNPVNPGDKPAKQRIAIGVPPMNEETDAIRKALVEFAENEPTIKALGFIATLREKAKGYACVVDCPKEGSRELFQQMLEKIEPIMKDVHSMEFMIRAEAPFADAYFSKIPYDYKG
jgi:hypothetical protein